ncbi:MAG: ABC transporter ATP-binding protein [Treponema sp.]|jgi:peptide/nickel transport system ATP-binding protein|nr:ABC transporter ATP-binding protein [Treponema sp.]
MENNIEIRDLTREFRMGSMIFGTKITAVDHVSLKIESGKPWIMSIVGESGSGKTTLARMFLRLLDATGGDILIGETPISSYSRNKKQFYRKVQPIFQNPFTTFSTRRTVDSYLFETARNLRIARNRIDAVRIISEALQSVGLEYEHIKGKYSSQFSGGELQRISIARALIPKPSLILADEPVAMIDASMRMNIVNLFKSLKNDYNISFIYITHDLSTAYYVSDYIAALYRGNLIEFGGARDVLDKPGHPYTELLLESIPRVGKLWDDNMVLPDLESKEYRLGGCKFVTRCPYAKDICREKRPAMINLEGNHQVLCYRHNNYESK